MRNVKIGLLGAGQVAHNHVKAFTAHSDCELVAVHDPNAARSAALCANVVGLSSYSSIQELLKANIDAVVITAPTQLHFKLGELVLNAGKHVLMEKPFTRNAAQAERLAEIASKRELVLMPAQVARFLPAVQTLHALIHNDDTGPLVQAVERRFLHRTEVFAWWKQLPEYLIAHWGSHSLDIFLWLADDEAVDVACWASSRQAGYDGVDDFTLVVKTASGAILSLHQTYASREELRDWVLVWEQGTAMLEGVGSLRWNRNSLVAEDPSISIDAAFASQATEFVGACRRDHARGTTVASVLPSIRAIDLAIAAAGIESS